MSNGVCVYYLDEVLVLYEETWKAVFSEKQVELHSVFIADITGNNNFPCLVFNDVNKSTKITINSQYCILYFFLFQIVAVIHSLLKLIELET